MTITSPNMGAKFNGMGAVDDVMLRKADAPMAYRILFPALIFRVSPKFKIPLYQMLLTLGSCFAFWTLSSSSSMIVSLISAVLVVTTFRFDYWDWIFEFGAMAAAIGNNNLLMFLWFTLFALSRETAVIAPVTYFAFHGFDLTGLALLATTAVVSFSARLWAGNKKLYCDRVMIRRNLSDVKKWLNEVNPKNWRPVLRSSNALSCNQVNAKCGRHTGGMGYAFLADDMSMTVLIALLGSLASFSLGFPRCMPWIALMTAGWTLAVARETRVFTSILIPISLYVASLLNY